MQSSGPSLAACARSASHAFRVVTRPVPHCGAPSCSAASASPSGTLTECAIERRRGHRVQAGAWRSRCGHATAHAAIAARAWRSRMAGRGHARCISLRSSAAEEASAPGQGPPPEPWTPDELKRMTEEEYLREDEAIGETWRECFEDDPEGLYEYTDRAYEEHHDLLDRIMHLNEQEAQDLDADQLIGAVPSPVANDIIGMGTWRLAGTADPAIQLLVSRFEGSWRELLRDDLNLYPPSEWKARGWDWCDSMDPHRELDGFAYADVPDPEPGTENYPRLFLENRMYCSRVFRKLHIEVGYRQDGLQVLHIVLYPRYGFDLPILAGDLVVTPNGSVSLAIIDACPVSSDLSLPPHYVQTMQELQQLFLTDPDNQRRIPEWGKAIFSPLCVCITPRDGEELAAFLRYAIALHRAHLMLSSLLQPVDDGSQRGASRAAELLAAHRRFVDKQLENDKTSRVLQAAFGDAWGVEYMREVMFDFRPGAEPPYVDASVFQMYDYFDANPELGDLPGEVLGLQSDIDRRRAQDYLDELLLSPGASNPLRPDRPSRSSDDEDADAGADAPLSSQASVSRKRAEWAMTKLYESDGEFRASVDALLPDAPELFADGVLGALLVEQLRGALEDGDVGSDGAAA